MLLRTFAVTLAALVMSTCASVGETIKVTLQLPENHYLAQNWRDFGDIVSQKTVGDLKVQLFPSAELFKDNQVPSAVGTGAVEAGSASLVQYAAAVPAVNVVSLPFLLDNEIKLKKATAPGSRLRQILDEAILKATNNRVLWWQSYGRNIYLSKGAPLIKPDDFIGKRVRTYGQVQDWTVEALGGIPMRVSGSQQYLAYESGSVDVGMTATTGVETRELYKVMDTLTLSHDSAVEFVAVMNNDFFERLSDEKQQAILDAAAQVEAQLAGFVHADEAAAADRLRGKMSVITLTEPQRAAFRAATAGVRKRFLDLSGDTGKAVLGAAESL
ncbi:C4-dicarboxylate-binding protein DctP [Roseibium hamelinense]|uniref:C4-dicarboxylate-binding protein DctP n=1 Tax=Roseibium hamelinense TaxID=150831 RepID=A0A562T8J9_9HYPH|nr:TRAP transporter substrate-binding protein DctP [Roseibium hamelinense]MTI42969.1 C4-dicarboxylate ABC transporter [Roseibium hamelinense]TWI89578.1 C4-dicarboxylate-binding protein DctP [Roseibium hamelinense]